MTINDAGFIQIVRGHFHIDLVADGDADEVFSHFARNMGEDFVSIGEGDPEHRAGQHLRHISSQFYWVFFWHNNVDPSNLRFSREKSNFFAQKTIGQSASFGYIFGHHEK